MHDRSFIGHVHLNKTSTEFGGSFLAAVGVTGAEVDFVVLIFKAAGSLKADTFVSPGDEGDL